MSTFSQLFRLTKANIKRLLIKLPGIITVAVFLLVSLSAAAIIVSDNLYKSENMDKINVAFYMPESNINTYSTAGYDLITNMQSLSNTAKLIEVDSVEAGKEMLSNGLVSYLIVIPESFFGGYKSSGIEVFFNASTSIMTYITNDLFMAFARYYSTAQTGVFAGLDDAELNSLSDSDRSGIIATLNFTFLDRALNKDAYTATYTATDVGVHSIEQHYMGVALLLAVSFTAFLMIPVLQSLNKGIRTKLSIFNINRWSIFISNAAALLPVFMLAFIPCLIAGQIYYREYTPLALVYALPVMCILALITSAFSTATDSMLAAELGFLIVILVLCYAGGGILPDGMLPKVVRSISHFLPGDLMIRFMTFALFGGGA